MNLDWERLVTNSSPSQHTKNDPREGLQWHREDVTQRNGAITIRCNMIDVAHGRWGLDSEDYATLVILLFRFDVKKRSRRISRADLTVEFFGEDEASPFTRPGVKAISFDDHLSYCEEKQSESTTKSAEGTAGLTGIQLAELSGSLKWEKTVSRETKSYLEVIGNMSRRKWNFGPDDQANWVLSENPVHQTGIPVAFRAAILLKREDHSPFKCKVDIKLKANLRSVLDSFRGSKEIDDPVLFNPKVKVKRDSRLDAVRDLNYDAIGGFDVAAVGDVTYRRIRDGAMKHE